MAHFAKLNESSIVTDVIVVNNNDMLDNDGNESEQVGIAFIKSILGEGTWVQTSYNGKFRKNFAGIGYYYDQTRDAFIPPQEYPSWILNEETCRWDPPVLYPDDGNSYVWDEINQNWTIIT